MEQKIQKDIKNEKKTRAFDVLEKFKDKQIIILLKDHNHLEGVLKAFDAHVNLFIQSSCCPLEEQNKKGQELPHVDAFLRGDSIVMIWLSPQP